MRNCSARLRCSRKPAHCGWVTVRAQPVPRMFQPCSTMPTARIVCASAPDGSPTGTRAALVAEAVLDLAARDGDVVEAAQAPRCRDGRPVTPLAVGRKARSSLKRSTGWLAGTGR